MYGMVKIEFWLMTKEINQQFVKRKKKYSILYITRGAYVVPATALLIQ